MNVLARIFVVGRVHVHTGLWRVCVYLMWTEMPTPILLTLIERHSGTWAGSMLVSWVGNKMPPSF